MEPKSVYRHLGPLEDHGLARRTEDGWVRGDADLDAVAADLGVAGTGFKQRAQHRAERASSERHRVKWDEVPEGTTWEHDVDPLTGEVLGDDRWLVEAPVAIPIRPEVQNVLVGSQP